MYGGIAQLVERFRHMEDVAGSSPVAAISLLLKGNVYEEADFGRVERSD